MGAIILTNQIYDIKSGTSKKYTALEETTEINVCIIFHEGGPPVYRWVDKIFYVEGPGDIEIQINDVTAIRYTEP